jgi:predicted ATPase
MAQLIGLGIENFRIFKDYTEFDFAPLTLLTGANNSGKSSLIKALLLLAVNAENRNIERFTLNTELRSAVTKLGNFESLVNNIENPHLTFHLYFDNLFEKLSRPVHIEKIADEIFAQLANHKTRITLKFDNKIKENLTFLAYDISVNNKFVNLFLIKFETDNSIEGYNNVEWLEQFIAEIIAKQKETYILKNNLNRVEEDIDSTRIKDIYSVIALTFDGLELAKKNNENENLRYFNVFDAIFCKLVEIALDTIKFEEKIEYLPAFRGNQDRFYRSDSNLPLNQLLKQFTDNNFDEKSIEKAYITYWVKELGIGDKIDFIPREGGTEVTITKNGKKLQMADIGYGMTQYLPLLLKIVLSEADYLIVEEAENSLHPDFQSKLADILVTAYKNFGTKFIIETHSEYLIRKLQILTKKGDITPEHSLIYYFGKETITKITIGSNGNISNDFGKGFIDESDDLALELHRLKHSKK